MMDGASEPSSSLKKSPMPLPGCWLSQLTVPLSSTQAPIPNLLKARVSHPQTSSNAKYRFVS